MASWGNPFSGTMKKVEGNHEITQGDHIAIKFQKGTATEVSEVYLKPALLYNEIVQQFQHEGHFQVRYCRISFTNPHGSPYGVTHYDIEVEIHAFVIHSSPLVISASWAIVALALTIFAIVVAFAIWSYYIFEKLGVAGGLGFFVIVAVILFIVLMALTGRRKGGG